MSGVDFSINGKPYKVSSVDGGTSLSDFIRQYAHLTGTKTMCSEGGCGACIVSVKTQHPVTNKDEIFAVNSCLVSVLSCHKWEVTTIEGIGSEFSGYHPIQERLAQFSGTQCGYCSPGFVMNMFSLMECGKGGMTMKEIENSFGSNTCRCTGYRPIADAMKSFATDVNPKLQETDLPDIEEMCRNGKTLCGKKCPVEESFCLLDAEVLRKVTLQDFPTTWYKAYSIEDIFSVLEEHGTDSYRLVAGNTAQGVYPFKQRTEDIPNIMIDITSVVDLRKHHLDGNFVLGACMTLSEVMDVLYTTYTTNEYFCYMKEMYKHLDLVAHVALRNIATLGGNLMIKHKDRRFPSDIFLLIETVGGTLTLMHKDMKIENVALLDFLEKDMKGVIIHSINLPPISTNCQVKTYKIMKRSQNEHAIVNAGFFFRMNNANQIDAVNIVYGGISEKFIHATATESFLFGKNLYNGDTFKLAMETLNKELTPDENEEEPSGDYRKKLAVGLFYKCIIQMAPTSVNINPLYTSGGLDFDRPVSSGTQKFDTTELKDKAVPKIEAIKQCSGEAKYIADIPPLANEAYAALVLSEVYEGEIVLIDGTEALKMDGVLSLLTHVDFPGANSFTPSFPTVFAEIEEVLCGGRVLYFGQPLALIVAETKKIAETAALKVKVTYKSPSKRNPLIKITDIIKDSDAKNRIKQVAKYDAKSKGDDVKKVIKGSFNFNGQYHFTMETQCCVCVPVEDGLDVHSSCQWIDWTQKAMSLALHIPENKINMNVRRLGGGFGSKISRSIQFAIACALAAIKLNRPVRIILPLETNVSTVGKRLPVYAEYEVGVNDNGKINYLNNKFYEDVGCSQNENSIVAMATEAFSNVYDKETWSVIGNAVVTDTASNTWFRGPGTTEGVCMIENIMDHIALEIGKDPLEVRQINMASNHKHGSDLIDSIKESSSYSERLSNVQNFNSKNRWRKRGISVMPLRFQIIYYGSLSVFVSAYHGDGTVVISHAGIEMGQGINTKVAQAAANTLNIPLEMISVKPSSNMVTPNVIFTGGSVTSEQCCQAAIAACKILLERLEPIKETMAKYEWKEAVEKAYFAGINLSAHHVTKATDLESYEVFGVTVTEVEVDMLIGSFQILRVDILEDSGETINPIIDVGQGEGAFVQGLGYWTCEQLKYSSRTGELLTNRTWNYKVPLMKDIPIDFRIELLKNLPSTNLTRSKTMGEPPLVMAFSVVSAVRQAIASARKDAGLPDGWFKMDLPLTPENVLMASEVRIEDFQLE